MRADGPTVKFPFRIRAPMWLGAASLALALPATVAALTVIGTPRADKLRGTPRADRIFGRGGDDLLRGRAGADLLYGDAGRDRIFGGPGNDTIYARDGERDNASCGSGRDVAVVDLVDRVARDCETVRRPGSGVGTRKNPVPARVPASLGDGWRLTVVSVVRNATAAVLNTDGSNTRPARGRQYFMVRVRASYSGRGSSQFHAGYRLRAVGGSQVAYATFRDSCGILPDPDLELEDPEVFRGGALEGHVCWSVRITDVPSLVMYNVGGSSGRRIFFALS